MQFNISFAVLCFLEVVHACIPTQHVEVTHKVAKVAKHKLTTVTTSTTTMTTTTTEAPGPASPCVVCQKVYDLTCQGYTQGSCATSSQASVSYSLGMVYTDETFHYYDDGACILSFKCPAGTTVMVDVLTGSPPSDPSMYDTGYCQEDMGSDPGTWYYGIYGVTDFDPVPMSSFRCQPT